MTWYESFLFFHVAMAAVWVGGGAMMQLFGLRTMKASDPARMASFAGDIEFLGMRVLTPASLLVLLAGIGMVVESDFLSFGDDWITLGLILFAVTAIAGMAFFGPEGGRIKKIIEAEGPQSPAALARIRRLLALTRADLMLLFLVIFVMTVKPTWDDTWLWVAVAFFAVLGVLLVRNGLQAKTAAASS